MPDEFEVRGIFDAGYYEYNASAFIITSLEDAQDLYVLGDTVHGLEVNLKDAGEAPAGSTAAHEKFGTTISHHHMDG